MKHNIEQLAESLVLTDPTDIQALAHVHDQFKKLLQLAEEQQHTLVTSAGSAAADLLERILLREVEDVAAAVGVISETVSILQSIISDGRGLEDVIFPEGLGLPVDNASGASQALPSNVDEEIFNEFLSRLPGTLDDMETQVLTLENAEGENQLDELLRLLHTLKGEAGMLGLAEAERLCHAAEDALAAVSPASLVDQLLNVKDWLKRMGNGYTGQGDKPEPVDQLISSLIAQNNDTGQAPEGDASVEAVQAEADSLEPCKLTGDPELTGEFIGEAREHLEASDTHLLTIEESPEDNDALNAVFRAFHTIKGVAGFLELADIQHLAHEAEYLLDDARTGKLILRATALDVTFEAVDMMKRLVDYTADALASGGLIRRDPLQSKLIERIRAVRAGQQLGGDGSSQAAAEQQAMQDPPVSQEAVPTAVSSSVGDRPVDQATAVDQPPSVAVGTPPVQPNPASGSPAAAGTADTKKGAQPGTPQSKSVKVADTVRVDAARLDALVDTIGEMVIAEAMVSQSSEIQSIESPYLTRLLSHLDKITRELQDMATSLRMMPIRPTFQRMARLVRDVAKKIDKQVHFSMTGEDTELDKSVVDQIGDPLVHMVRNAVDHGIEATLEERRKAGKPDMGQVQLRAFHKSGSINIEIEDDGRGLDRERLLKKAREQGLVREGDNLTDSEVFNLIFEPGFSTAKVVSDVSGRGVGMDVVKRNIQALRGQIDIQSTLGKGSIFTIRLPLTLAIIEGMVVRVGSQRFIVPLLLITRMLRPEEHGGVPTVFGQAEMLSVSGGLIPLYRLHQIFGIVDAQEDPAQAAVVIVEYEGRKFGILVDELLGQQQIVIKSLGESLQKTECIAGGAIMPDGRVGLIIDMDSLVKTATRDPSAIPKAA